MIAQIASLQTNRKLLGQKKEGRAEPPHRRRPPSAEGWPPPACILDVGMSSVVVPISFPSQNPPSLFGFD